MLRDDPKRSCPRVSRVALPLLVLLALASTARAQPLKPVINPNTSPIVVTIQPEKVAVRPDVEEQALLNIAFGATINGGNTKSYGGTLGGRAGYLRDRHQLMLEALGTMGGARQDRLTEVEWTSRNVVARLRYDLFLSENDALFVALAPRRDVFAGLNLRLQNQIGYLRNLFHYSDAHRFWTELGYDFTFDKFSIVETQQSTDITDQVRAVDPTLVPEGATITRTSRMREPGGDHFVHSARVFLGYTNRLFAASNLSMGLETLLDFQEARNVRLNGLVELTSSVTDTFKLGVQARVMFDNVPVPGTRTYDTVTAVQLVYTFDSLAGRVVEVCPVCDCSAAVEAARAVCKAREPSLPPGAP